MVWLHWCFQTVAAGAWPSARHDWTAFGTHDASRHSMAGEPTIKAALVYLMGDWAEIVETWGLQSWSNVLHPCFCCFAVRDDMDRVGELSVVSEPWEAKTHADYEDACRLCERHIVVQHSAASCASGRPPQLYEPGVYQERGHG